MSNLLTVLAFLASAPAPEPPPPDPGQPLLVAKGKGYLIHALPSAPVVIGPAKEAPRKIYWGIGDFFRPSGVALTYTFTVTGDMKYLLVGGQSSLAGPPMNVDYVYHTLFRIAGVIADSDRLYVVWYREERTEMAGVARPAYAGKGTYRLLVFRLASGELLHDLEMKEGDFPEGGLPPESREAGPLKLTNAGVSCYGVTFDFDGATLVRQHYDGKP